jgi:DNA-binding transcriptional LysR family regulator
MTMLDTRRLHYFIEVVDYGSINKAAGRLGITQPALTKSLRELERELKVTLLERSAAGVTPTVFGRSLYAHARAIAAEIEHAQVELRRLGGGEGGYVRVGALPSVSGGLVARAVAGLMQRHPELFVRVVEKQNYELLPALRRREFDFVVALLDDVEPEPGVRHRVVLRDWLRIVAREGHPLQGEREVTCEQLVRYPWVHPVVGTTHRPILKLLFRDSGIDPPQPRMECGSVQFAKTIIGRSDALGLLPEHAIQPELHAGAMFSLPVVSEDLRRTVAIHYRGTRPPAGSAAVVMREIERVCGEWMGRTAAV